LSKLLDEEKGHIYFWEQSLSLVEQDMVPEIFANPSSIIRELDALISKFDSIEQSYRPPISLNEMLLCTFRFEYYLLNPIFIQIFSFMKPVWTSYNPSTDYYDHLMHFINMLRFHSQSDQAIDLLGDTLLTLWRYISSLTKELSTDRLTGVMTRRIFLETAIPLAFLAQRNRMNIGIIMADIDNFKKINDSSGHVKGDEVLKAVGEALRNSIRRSDLVGRYGGEEFILFYPELTTESVPGIVRKIRENVDKQTASVIPVTLSMGIVIDKIDLPVEKHVWDMIDKADSLLYKAKHEGKDRACTEFGTFQ